MLRFWQPKGGEEARERLRLAQEEHSAPTGTAAAAWRSRQPFHRELLRRPHVMAFLPYLVVIVVFSLAKLWTPLKTCLAGTDTKIPWPGLDGNILTVTGTPSTATTVHADLAVRRRHPVADLRPHRGGRLPDLPMVAVKEFGATS